MAQLMLSNQQKYVPTLKTIEETIILKPIPLHGDQLFEERARNIQWVYQDGDSEFDRIKGLNTEFYRLAGKAEFVYGLYFDTF